MRRPSRFSPASGLLLLLVLLLLHFFPSPSSAFQPPKERMVRQFGAGQGPSRPSELLVLPGIIVTEAGGGGGGGGGGVTDATEVWANYSLALPPWATKSDASFALWGGGNFANYMWGGPPLYIADHACQGGLIFEKTLCMGGQADYDIALWQLATFPFLADGRPWEAQNSETHVSHQGNWEGPGEALIEMKMYAAHVGDAAPFTSAPERLVCVSGDGGKMWRLAGVAQPGLSDAVCGVAPSTLPMVPGETLKSSFPAAAAAPNGTSPYLFYDVPSCPFVEPAPSGGNPLIPNSGRMLTEAVTLNQPFTAVAIPLVKRVHSSNEIWYANATVLDALSGSIVGTALIQPPSGGSGGFGSQWTTIAVSCGGGGGPCPAGTYIVALTAEDTFPGDQKASDSWFLGVGWVTNVRPASPGGGASSASYGPSKLFLRDPSSSPSRPKLLNTSVPNVSAALALEATRVRSALKTSGSALGRSLADYAAMAASNILALSSQLPAAGGADAVPGGYDVYVIPDPLYRGSGEPDVNTGCSYYDVIRIGFASSYINLRVFEGLEAYAELQDAGLVPSDCAGASSVGTDNADLLSTGVTPCYTRSDIASILSSMRVAIGDRFSNSATGEFVDWFGCACFGQEGAAVADCGLHLVHNGTVPSGTPAAQCLNPVSTDFVPTIALATKLGIPAGGVSAAATTSHFEFVRDTGANAGNASYGPGWWHTSLRGLETTPTGAGAWVANVGWALRDTDGFAVRSTNETGDWHFFSPSSIREGFSTGLGNHPTNAENGGKFFPTGGLIWEAHSVPGSATSPSGPYPSMYRDWKRLVDGVASVGTQMAAGNYTAPLLPSDRNFLSTPVEDPLVTYLCVKVRNQFHFPNVTDLWGQILCDYYQDVGWGTPENGVAYFHFVKGLLGLRVWANGALSLLGQGQSPTPLPLPWTVSSPLAAGWPTEVETVAVNNLSVGGVSVVVSCTADAGAGKVECQVTSAAAAGGR